MPRIRDRRAAALAALLGVLGVTSTAMGLRSEASTLPPVAAQEPGPDSVTPSPATPSPATPSPATSSPAQASPAQAGLVTSSPVASKKAGATDGAAPAVTDSDQESDSVPAPPSTAPKPRTAKGMKRSEPVRLEIPAVGLKTAVNSLGLREDGTLEVPPLRADAPAGWYRGSPTPGEAGAAVMTGHVDSAREGPAVFYRLRELALGDTISVRRKDGSTAKFEVYRVATYPKHAFPSGDVYGAVDRAELRLITCGGSFDRSKRSYRDNVVVFAAPPS
ncbi:class F sortase [Actinoplanes sp. NPDC023714]|uniref:class F sortase n=1 Tax=Actinoplanes sp. NPDC023714 TaxID=3154322 RepID=UPI0033D16E81